MSLDELLRSLLDDADAEVRDIVGAARDEADRLVAEAQAHAELRRQAERAALTAEHARALADGLAEARLAARDRVLTARAALIERVLVAAREQLARPGTLLGWADEHLVDALAVARAFVVGDTVVTCRPELADAVRAAAPDVEIRPDPEGGLVVGDAAGHVRIDLGLAARLDARRPLLALRIAELAEAADA